MAGHADAADTTWTPTAWPLTLSHCLQTSAILHRLCSSFVPFCRCSHGSAILSSYFLRHFVSGISFQFHFASFFPIIRLVTAVKFRMMFIIRFDCAQHFPSTFSAIPYKDLVTFRVSDSQRHQLRFSSTSYRCYCII